MKFKFAWPDKCLLPNKRTDARRKAPVIKAERQAAWAVVVSEFTPAQLAEVRESLTGRTRIPLKITFYPPDKRARDSDGALSASKAMLDGLADGLGVNDKYFRPLTLDWGPECEGGRVEVEI